MSNLSLAARATFNEGEALSIAARLGRLPTSQRGYPLADSQPEQHPTIKRAERRAMEKAAKKAAKKARKEQA